MELYYRKSKAKKFWLLLEDSVDKVFPRWLNTAYRHHEDYRAFVEHWLTAALTPEDWARAHTWAEKRNMAFLPWLFKGPSPLGFVWERFLINEYKKNPAQPYEIAYRQVLQLINEEGQGDLRHRPLFCSECKTLFQPARLSQRWCSDKCRNRFFQRQYRQADKEDRSSEENKSTKGKES
jgi:hypothetical protein